MGSPLESQPKPGKVRFIPLSYNQSDSQTSALRLILTLRPDWENTDGKIEFIRFTDGITNTLLKVINKRPNLSPEEIDDEAVLLRAYGQGTDLIIDRERETQNHELLMQYNLAPALLARFHNGMLYRFIQGSVTSPADLQRKEIWRAVAKRLAEWHAVVPCLPSARAPLSAEIVGSEEIGISAPTPSKKDPALQSAIDSVAPGKLAPNVWTVMQKWIYALPTKTETEKSRQASLQKELTKIVEEFSNRPGLGKDSLVFAHCDLLSGNVIIQPKKTGTTTPSDKEIVSFIDYEYATPSPAAFDIANHFAEWGGFDCEHHLLPAKSQRLDFIREYIRSYFSFQKPDSPVDEETEIRKLFDEVDVWRGIPGFYWGIWALIQATISQIDFDYASYAEVRLGEYWAWRAEGDGSRVAEGREISVRERRWAEES
ncbi:Protein kinase-like (PK-like) [Glarea lozoyensis ATCC 20868]|uniref:ethanolamine kinase n=1 Tax=Glarea lozoyensis (strain ATCC 20868 / MF5171) TaxID=1116229 RepID=S3DF16_GLAL2|nr:Protein kinase-like (PK-like) [Glarea lozoyensis ATCC 20868]EPE36325.1 Protein kinase-like (PK-like) [Glarea lozoyensis ATCC 20868]